MFKRLLPLALLLLIPVSAFAGNSIGTVTLDGQPTVTVAPAATIAVSVEGILDNGDDWEGTSWEVELEGDGNAIPDGGECVNTSDSTDNTPGTTTFTKSFNITAPSVDGVYNMAVKIYGTDNCTSQLRAHKTIDDAVTVVTPVPVDNVPPVITLVGSPLVNLVYGDNYTDEGATALDDVDGNITANIVTVNPVSTTTVGNYTVTYDVQDSSGNAATQVIRTVNVVDPTCPAGQHVVNHQCKNICDVGSHWNASLPGCVTDSGQNPPSGGGGGSAPVQQNGAVLLNIPEGQKSCLGLSGAAMDACATFNNNVAAGVANVVTAAQAAGSATTTADKDAIAKKLIEVLKQLIDLLMQLQQKQVGGKG